MSDSSNARSTLNITSEDPIPKRLSFEENVQVLYIFDKLGKLAEFTKVYGIDTIS